MNRTYIYATRYTIFLALGLLIAAACKKAELEVPQLEENTTNGKTMASFNPHLEYGTFVDQDQNEYRTIRIGNQIWMAENLRTTRYNDGTPIPYAETSADWEKAADAYCNYEHDNSDAAVATYGRLYNGAAIRTGKLAPAGWRIPTKADWETLAAQLGGPELAGGKLKEAGLVHWFAPNEAATNESGFTALAAGYRHALGAFAGRNVQAIFHSATFHPLSSDPILGSYNPVYSPKIEYHKEGIILSSFQQGSVGLPLRLVKDME